MAEEPECLASIDATSNNFREMINTASVMQGNSSPFEFIYLNIGGGEVRTLGSYNGELVSYCTFKNDYFDDVEGEVQALIRPEEILEVMDIVSNDGYVDFDLWGKPDDDLAPQCRISGDLRSTLALSAGNNRFESLPTGTFDRFDDKNNFIKKDGDALETSIIADVNQLQRIIQATKFRSKNRSKDEESFFPVVVTDEELVLNVGEEYDRQITGDLVAEEVSGPDVDNYYGETFEQLINPINGTVQIYIEHENPVVLVQDNDNYTFRGIVAPKTKHA